jgi:hypothetical protein
MNLLLGINTVLALFALFATTICVLGWVCLWLLKRVARLLSPLAKEEEAQRAPARPRDRLEAAPKTAG